MLSEACLDYLRFQDVLVQYIPDQNHSALGIIDRFIRTLRDMQGDNTSIKPKRMKQLIILYNNTYHSSIKMSPKNV